MASAGNKTDPHTSRTEAEHYDRFFGPFYFEPYAIEVARRIDPSTALHVLELAAGTGRVTRHIRNRLLPEATLVVSDIDAGMLDIAKEVLAKDKLVTEPLANDKPAIEWVIADAQALPFEAASFDLLVCCFGFMFIPDKPTAFAEAVRVLRPGGKILFTTWDTLPNNPASHIARTTAEQYIGRPLPESANQATSMSDPEMLRALLDSAGFTGINVEIVGLVSVIPSAREGAEGFVQGGIYDEMRQRDPVTFTQIREKVEERFAAAFGVAPMKANISALIGEASTQAKPAG